MRAICESCKHQKYQLHPHDSVLYAGHRLIMCMDCINKGYEPRSLVIIAAQQYGTGHSVVKKFIENKLYVGETIPAVDVLS